MSLFIEEIGTGKEKKNLSEDIRRLLPEETATFSILISRKKKEIQVKTGGGPSLL